MLLQFVKTFGGVQGTEAGQFNHPRGLFVDSLQDHLYVCDTMNDRIQILCRGNGGHITTFGRQGTGNGEFNQPKKLFVDSCHQLLYVADTWNHRVQIFSMENGELKWRRNIGYGQGKGDGELQHTTDVFVDCTRDTVYVSDGKNHRIVVFNCEGKWIRNIGSGQSSAEAQFNFPSSLFVDVHSRILYVCDYWNHRIQLLNADTGVFLRSIGCQGAGDGQFINPAGIFVDLTNQLLYVTDSNNHRVQVMSLVDGSFIAKCGSGVSGKGDGQFDTPTRLYVDVEGKLLYVSDMNNDRIQVFQIVPQFNSSLSTPSIPSIVDHPPSPSQLQQNNKHIETYTQANHSSYTLDSSHSTSSTGNSVMKVQPLSPTGASMLSSPRRSPHFSMSSHVAAHSPINRERANREREEFKLQRKMRSVRSMNKHIGFQYDHAQLSSNYDSDDSQFSRPHGVMVDDTQQLLYVCDTNHRCIQVLHTKDGSVNRVISSTGNVEFVYPISLCMDEAQQLLYVLDAELRKIIVINVANGGAEWVKNICEGQLLSPNDIFIDCQRQLIYIVDNGKNCVQIVHAGDGQCVRYVGAQKDNAAGSGEGQFDYPSSVFVDTQSRLLYVCDTNNHRIQIFHADEGTFIRAIGVQGTAAGELKYPRGIYVDVSTSSLFVVDSGNDRLQVFNVNTGKVILQYSSEHVGHGQFDNPTYICADARRKSLYISDTDNDKIQVFVVSVHHQNLYIRLSHMLPLHPSAKLRKSTSEFRLSTAPNATDPLHTFDPDSSLSPSAAVSHPSSTSESAEEEDNQAQCVNPLCLFQQLVHDDVQARTCGLNQSFTLIPDSDLKIGKRLGHGGFGDVFQAEWRNQMVAYKRLRIHYIDIRVDALLRHEISVMCCIDHAHVVKIFGVMANCYHYGIVMELCNMGSLHDVLHRKPEIVLSWHDKVSIVLQMSKALDHLHSQSPRIYHRDLKTSNIVVHLNQDGSYTVKITDFGLSEIRKESSRQSTQLQIKPFVGGTLQYTDPELLQGFDAQFSSKSDIYSLGVVLWELATNKIPYQDQGDALIRELVKAGERSFAHACSALLFFCCNVMFLICSHGIMLMCIQVRDSFINSTKLA